MFSKACEYAMRAVVCIAGHGVEGRSVALKTIAQETDSPEAFTAKVLQKLTRAELVLSTKGPGGGFSMPPALAGKVKLSQIVSVIDGDSIYTGCALGLPQCDARNPCALHEHLLKVREDLRSMLCRTIMFDVVKSMKEGVMVLRRSDPWVSTNLSLSTAFNC